MNPVVKEQSPAQLARNAALAERAKLPRNPARGDPIVEQKAWEKKNAENAVKDFAKLKVAAFRVVIRKDVTVALNAKAVEADIISRQVFRGTVEKAEKMLIEQIEFLEKHLHRGLWGEVWNPMGVKVRIVPKRTTVTLNAMPPRLSIPLDVAHENIARIEQKMAA